LRLTWSASEGRAAGSGAAPIWFFKANPKFFKIQPSQPNVQPIFSKNKAWIPLEFFVGSGEKIIHGFGAARCVIEPTICALSVVVLGYAA
jgi:hypothetical protein